MRVLLAAAFALFAGLMMTRAFKYLHLKFPDVTAFLIAGVLVGPFVLGRIGVPGLGFCSENELGRVSVISSAALGFIAFDIGNEFRLAQLRQTGKTAVVIGIVQALAAALLVDDVLIVLHFILGEKVLPLPVAITLGAIASATAPAATLMVVRQYKAKGEVTDLLLPIVALDDAVGLVVFAVSFGVAQAINGGNPDIVSIMINPLLEIVCSLTLGSIMGGLLTWLEKIFFSNSNRLSLTISFVLMTIALSSVEIPLGGELRISFSSLLVCMMLGTMFCNLSEYSSDIMARSGRWTAPLYAVFFVLSGAQLDLGVFRYPIIIVIGAVYILVRCAGKYLGARFSSAAMKCSATVRKYLGVTLFPQAGVALGMVVTAQALGEDMGHMVRNIILFSVLVYELVGPMLTKLALTKSGEIEAAASDEQNRARFEKKLHHRAKQH
ncbi:MAG: cation:proton antiporter [Oscillospiraceae bacterium]|nr:cation:proton antiporter [Oscillospiraceae bacterium]